MIRKVLRFNAVVVLVLFFFILIQITFRPYCVAVVL